MNFRRPRLSILRRRLLALLGGAVCAPMSLAGETRNERQATPFARVVPGYRIQFPRDEGSHPDFRLEWWYVTGWLEEATGPLGFQVTFFRARPQLAHDNPSAFTPRHIVIAHAALSDPSHGRLVAAQRSARAAFGLAGAAQGSAKVWLDDWTLEQQGRRYRCRIPAPELDFDLAFAATQPPLLQGDHGLSRKGPRAPSASYYYSLPHLEVSGSVRRGGGARAVTGSAWLDHEWSSEYLDSEAVGWDWIGVNLRDGAALMAFRMRRHDGSPWWAGGALRAADGSVRTFSPDEVEFTPRRQWRSPRTGTAYPVSWRVKAAGAEFEIEPLFDDQEHDARASTGTVYWEGAARALRHGRLLGSGYLELTGYGRRPDL